MFADKVGTGDARTAFEKSLRKQLAALLSTSSFNVRNLNAEAGSILVDFEAAAYEEDEKGQMQKSYDDLAKMFQDGTVKLVIFLFLADKVGEVHF